MALSIAVVVLVGIGLFAAVRIAMGNGVNPDVAARLCRIALTMRRRPWLLYRLPLLLFALFAMVGAFTVRERPLLGVVSILFAVGGALQVVRFWRSPCAEKSA